MPCRAGFTQCSLHGLMTFLDQFQGTDRDLFESAGQTLELARATYLMRRGEPGGDIYLVCSGSLEVVDTRSVPEVILAHVRPGALVGEMAFVDNSPRSADVRAAADTVVLHWTRDDLRALFQRHPGFAATFFENISRLAVERIRSLTSNAIAGALRRESQATQAGLDQVRSEARDAAERAKEGFLDCEERLASASPTGVAETALRAVLDRLQKDAHDLFTAHHTVGEAEEAARILSRELHPYLVRSSLASRCIRRPQGASGTAEILAHVFVDTASGDGPLGEALDRWLLDRPSLFAQRQLRAEIASTVAASLPKHRNRRVLVVNAGAGSLLANVTHLVAHPPTVITVVDQSRDALAFLDVGITTRPRAVELITRQENLAQFALGRHQHNYPAQDVVVLHGLLEYMPDRVATSLLRVAAQLLAPHGTVVATALEDCHDDHLLGWLFSWPTVRRTREGVRRIVRAAQLQLHDEPTVVAPAVLFTAGHGNAVATSDSDGP